VHFSGLELVEDSSKRYSFSAFCALFFARASSFDQRLSDFGKRFLGGAKPPLGHGCLEISKGNLAVEKLLAETVQVFDQKSAYFQRKRRRDVCKNALSHFVWQRLFKFLR